MPRISRRKYAEALRCLKNAIKNDKLPWTIRIRCVELLLSIYNVPVPDGGRRERRAVRELVEERAGERSINEQIKLAVQDRVRQEAEQEEQERISQALQDFMEKGQNATGQ